MVTASEAGAAIAPAIVQRAAEWMARLWSGEASGEEQAACAAWRAADPDHEQAWQRLHMLERKLSSVPAVVASRALRAPAQAAQPAQAARRRTLSMLGLGAAAGGLAWLVRGSDSWQLAMSAHRSATGEMRELALPDGTRVTLASASAIDIQFSAAERLIVLRAGEILVTTAPDTMPLARPLRVQSAQGTVRALGTRFTVRQDSGAVRVAVFEGAVEIRPQQADGAAVRVDAAQGVRFTATRAGPVHPVQESAAAWSRGVLVADGMRLGEFVAELGRYRPGLLRCDPAVAALRVSGVFSLRDTGRALHNLTLGLPVAVSFRTRYWATVHAA